MPFLFEAEVCALPALNRAKTWRVSGAISPQGPRIKMVCTGQQGRPLPLLWFSAPGEGRCLYLKLSCLWAWAPAALLTYRKGLLLLLN